MAAAVSMAALASIFVLMGALPHLARAHAGHMHQYPDTPSSPENNYIRLAAGQCNTWNSLNATSNITMTGTAVLWVYLYHNCTDTTSTAVEFNTVMSQNGSPFANQTIGGNSYTDSCANGGTTYFQNATLGDDDENMIWFHDFITNATSGGVRGNAANTFVVRGLDSANTAATPTIKSFRVSAEGYGDVLCCDFTITPVNVASLYLVPGGSTCYATSPPPPASPPPPSGSASGLQVSLLLLFAAAALLLSMWQ